MRLHIPIPKTLVHWSLAAIAASALGAGAMGLPTLVAQAQSQSLFDQDHDFQVSDTNPYLTCDLRSIEKNTKETDLTAVIKHDLPIVDFDYVQGTVKPEPKPGDEVNFAGDHRVGLLEKGTNTLFMIKAVDSGGNEVKCKVLAGTIEFKLKDVGGSGKPPPSSSKPPSSEPSSEPSSQPSSEPSSQPSSEPSSEPPSSQPPSSSEPCDDENGRCNSSSEPPSSEPPSSEPPSSEPPSSEPPSSEPPSSEPPSSEPPSSEPPSSEPPSSEPPLQCGPNETPNGNGTQCVPNGNEGLGNGSDPPPPGHESNQNDCEGTEPGSPGAQTGACDD